MERWVDIPGYEGVYKVSTTGKVKSINRWVQRGSGQMYIKDRYMKLSINAGYAYVVLIKAGKIKSFAVHRLVAQAFIPNPQDLPQVNHKDGDKLNNDVSNLEWVSSSGNMLHAVYTGLNSQARQVRCIETGEIFPSMRQAEIAHGWYVGAVSYLLETGKSRDGYSFRII